MRKKDIAERLAQQTKKTAGAAADELDDAISSVLKNLRHRQRPAPNALQRLIEEAKPEPGKKGRHAKS
jgi:hypothetical protein